MLAAYSPDLPMYNGSTFAANSQAVGDINSLCFMREQAAIAASSIDGNVYSYLITWYPSTTNTELTYEVESVTFYQCKSSYVADSSKCVKIGVSNANEKLKYVLGDKQYKSNSPWC